MPISHPSYYATYLAKKVGPFATLGLAEDTWALNEGVTDDGTFLRADLRYRSRAGGDVLRRARRLRQRQPRLRLRRHRPHPAHVLARPRRRPPGGARADKARAPATPSASSTGTTTRLVGRSASSMREGDVLMVISDHGFTSFRRGVNLNTGCCGRATWRSRPGRRQRRVAARRRLVDDAGLRARADRDVLNLKGREAQGIVEPGAEAAALKAEIIAQAARPARRRADGGRHQRGVRLPRRFTPDPISRTRPT